MARRTSNVGSHHRRVEGPLGAGRPRRDRRRLRARRRRLRNSATRVRRRSPTSPRTRRHSHAHGQAEDAGRSRPHFRSPTARTHFASACTAGQSQPPCFCPPTPLGRRASQWWCLCLYILFVSWYSWVCSFRASLHKAAARAFTRWAAPLHAHQSLLQLSPPSSPTSMRSTTTAQDVSSAGRAWNGDDVFSPSLPAADRTRRRLRLYRFFVADVVNTTAVDRLRPRCSATPAATCAS